MMEEQQKQLALELFNAGVFQTWESSQDGKGFKIKAHNLDDTQPRSPYYFNLRTHNHPHGGPLNPVLLQKIGDELLKRARTYNINFDCVVGIPSTGEPLADAFVHAMAYQKNVRRAFLEKEERHGLRHIARVTKGNFKRGDRVLLIDDVLSGADSKFESERALHEVGLEVHDVLVVLDREQGGIQKLVRAGFNVHTLFAITQLIELYLETGRLGDDQYTRIAQYVRSNG